jgi:hypothetical protein
MELYVQEPAARSAMAKSRVVTMYHYGGKEAPLHLNAFSWPLGLVLSLPILIAFEVVASIYLKRGPSVIKGGKGRSLWTRRRSAAKERAGEPPPYDSYVVPEVCVGGGDLGDRDDVEAPAVTNLQLTDPSTPEYDRLCALAVDDMSPADTGGSTPPSADTGESTPPFGFTEPRHDASLQPLTVGGSAAVSPAVSPRTAAPAAPPIPLKLTD